MRTLRAVLTLALAVVLPLLAGCSGTGGGGAADAEVEATATTGVLRGVVVDEAIRPLLGVNVTVPMADGTTISRMTADDGLFAFDGLPPGPYVVNARKLGFLDASVAANVTAGVDVPDSVRVLMPADVLNTPAIDQYSFDGFLQCSATAFYARAAACNPDEAAQPLCQLPGEPCTNGPANLTTDEFMAVHTVARQSVRFLQSEMVWEATQQGSASLRALPGSRDPASGEINDYQPFEGPSPLIMPMDGAIAQALFIGNGKDLVVRVFSGYVPGTNPPACLPSPLGCPWGVGVSYEQRFQIVTHVFFGFEPPEGWQFGRDGLPPIPA